MAKPIMYVRNVAEAEALAARVREGAEHLQAWIVAHRGDSLALLRALKFDQVGTHPTDGHALNAIEQVNQTWTYLVAIAAARQLLLLHPEASGFRLAPGAHASQALDLMSEVEGLVGAETFASVDPKNNRKLALDLDKLAGRAETHRYVFFASPLYRGTKRLDRLERDGIQVWSVDV